MRNVKRKIIRQGNNSFTVTLPMKWVKEDKLDTLGYIDLTREERGILIELPHNSTLPEARAEIDVKDANERTTRNMIYNVYRKGYDIIDIIYRDKKQLDYITNYVLDTILGFEVTSNSDNRCVIENIAEPNKEKFGPLLRRLFLTIKVDAQEMLEQLQSGNVQDFSTRQQVRNRVDMYSNLCRRLIVNYKIGGDKNSYVLVLAMSRLQHINHSFTYLHKHCIELGVKHIEDDVAKLLQVCIDMFDGLQSGFYKRSIEDLEQVGSIFDEHYYGTLYELLESNKSSSKVLLLHVGESMRLIHLTSTMMFGIMDLEKI